MKFHNGWNLTQLSEDCSLQSPRVNDIRIPLPGFGNALPSEIILFEKRVKALPSDIEMRPQTIDFLDLLPAAFLNSGTQRRTSFPSLYSAWTTFIA